MATAQKIFDLAMNLMDELSHENGHSVHEDTRDYLRRTPAILTTLCGEIYKFSDTWRATDVNVRPVFRVIERPEDEVELDDFLTHTVLPYGLASHLLAEESPAFASFFLQRYQGLLINYGGAIPGATESIRNLYGGFDG